MTKRKQIKLAWRKQRRLERLCPAIANLEKEFGEASAEEVADILIHEFNWKEGMIKFPSGRECTVETVYKICQNKKISARSVSPILFYGGLPNDVAKQYKGSLLTLLFDRILYTHYTSGGYTDLIHA